jgi:hypothetical protein
MVVCDPKDSEPENKINKELPVELRAGKIPRRFA